MGQGGGGWVSEGLRARRSWKGWGDSGWGWGAGRLLLAPEPRGPMTTPDCRPGPFAVKLVMPSPGGREGAMVAAVPCLVDLWVSQTGN